MGLPLVDLDSEIENKAGRSISDIFRSGRRAAFREMEYNMLASCLAAGRAKFWRRRGGVMLREI
jgi:shikimate kinase